MLPAPSAKLPLPDACCFDVLRADPGLPPELKLWLVLLGL
jgi:hypothetical protein